MKKIMIGVGLGLAGMSQAHAWNGGIEDMRTMQDNTSGQVVRVKSSTTDCCTLRPMRSHGHQHQHKMIHNGQVYYCTRVAGHAGKHVTHHPAKVKQHYQQQTQQAVNAQRAKRQAMYAAKAKRKALLLAQQRKRAQMLAAQKRKAVLLAQQKQRAAHQALMQAQQRKRAAQLQQQKRKLQLLAQQRRQAAHQRAVVAAKPRPQPHYRAPQQVVVVKPQYHKPQYQSSYQRYHYQQPAPRPRVSTQQSVRHHDRNRKWHRSHSVRMQPIQRVIKPQRVQRPVRSYSAQQSVVRHDAVMAQRQHVARVRAAQLHAQKQRQQARLQKHRFVPVQQSVTRHDAYQRNHSRGWQRAATVQSHGVRTHKPRQIAMVKRSHAADCGC